MGDFLFRWKKDSAAAFSPKNLPFQPNDFFPFSFKMILQRRKSWSKQANGGELPSFSALSSALWPLQHCRVWRINRSKPMNSKGFYFADERSAEQRRDWLGRGNRRNGGERWTEGQREENAEQIKAEKEKKRYWSASILLCLDAADKCHHQQSAFKLI